MISSFVSNVVTMQSSLAIGKNNSKSDTEPGNEPDTRERKRKRANSTHSDGTSNEADNSVSADAEGTGTGQSGCPPESKTVDDGTVSIA